MTLPTDTPALFQRIWADLHAGRTDLAQTWLYLDTALPEHRGSVFLQTNYLVHLDTQPRIQLLCDKLDAVAPLSLAIAPERVAAFDADGETLLITRYAAVPGETLQPVRLWSTPLPRPVRHRALEQVRILFEAGLNHAWLTRSEAHWYRGERSGTLAANAWEMLDFHPPKYPEVDLQEMEQWLERLDPP